MAPNGLSEKLENTDVILINHDHKDHINDVTANRLRREVTLVVGPERGIKEIADGFYILGKQVPKCILYWEILMQNLTPVI